MDRERVLWTLILFVASGITLVIGVKSEWPASDSVAPESVYRRVLKVWALVAGIRGLIGVVCVLVAST